MQKMWHVFSQQPHTEFHCDDRGKICRCCHEELRSVRVSGDSLVVRGHLFHRWVEDFEETPVVSFQPGSWKLELVVVSLRWFEVPAARPIHRSLTVRTQRGQKQDVNTTECGPRRRRTTVCRSCWSYSSNARAGSLMRTDMFGLLGDGFLSSCALPGPPEAKCFVVP